MDSTLTKLLIVSLIFGNLQFSLKCRAQSPSPSDGCPQGWGQVKKYDFSSMNQVNNDWNVIVWPKGKVNNEMQSYVNDPKNLFTRKGNLIVKAIRNGEDYTSGRIESKQTYMTMSAPGQKLRVEFTGKVPTAMGAWPAYWLLGEDGVYGGWPGLGEIDVMEWAHFLSGNYNATIHWKENRQEGRAFEISTQEMVSNFITYGVEYSAVENDEYILYYMRRSNGREIKAKKIDRKIWDDFNRCPGGRKPGRFPCSTFAPFDNKMRLIINLAVGGDFGGKDVTNYDAFKDGVEFETSSAIVCQKQ